MTEANYEEFALLHEQRNELLEEARAIVASESNRRPTRLHLWAALSALDGSDRMPPPTAYGQMPLPLERRH